MSADWLTISLSALTFCYVVVLLGGVVKGVTGFGLPTFAVPLMVNVVPLQTAIAMIALSLVVSNLWQAANWPVLRSLLPRFWPLFLSLTIGVAAGSQILLGLEPRTLNLILGSAILVAQAAQLARPKGISVGEERWLNPFVGLGAGFLGGVTSLFGSFIAMYLNALDLNRDRFVVLISATYCVGLLPLNLTLVAKGAFGLDELALSAVTLIPVSIGITIGQRLRRFVNAQLFRWLVIAIVIGSALSLLARGLM